MKSVPKESIRNAVIMTVVTILMTVLVATVDVQPVGVEGTDLGFASINTGFFNRFGENHTFYLLSSSALLRGCVFLFVFGDKGAASTAFFAYAAFLIALYYNDDPLIRAAAGKIRSVFE